MQRNAWQYGIIVAAAAILVTVGVVTLMIPDGQAPDGPAAPPAGVGLRFSKQPSAPQGDPTLSSMPSGIGDNARGPGRASKSVGAPPKQSDSLIFEPTERLTELLAAFEGPLFRAELLAKISRHIEEEGGALRVEGLIEPLQEILQHLETEAKLPDTLRTVLAGHGEWGRRSLNRFLDFQHARYVQKLEEAGDDESRALPIQLKIDGVEELRQELEQSITGS